MKQPLPKPKFTKTKVKTKNYLAKLNFTGLIFGLVFFCFSVLPSLLPRPWLYQGLISGISIAIGYGLGVFISIVIRWIFEYEPPKIIKIWAWQILKIVGIPIFILYLYLGTIWQAEITKLIEKDSTGNRYLIRTFLLTFVVSMLLIGLGRLLSRFNSWVIKQIDKILPRRASIGFGFIIVVLLAWWVLSGVFFNFFVTQSNKIYANRNKSTPEGVFQPTNANRSGSNQSLISWDTLGFQGRRFVNGGASKQQIEQFTELPAQDSIRVYVGLNSANSATERARLAVEELNRLHAFDKQVLVVATPTGTGWLEPQTVDSLEYMFGGDTAIVAQQYSYLPSWISFLVDQQNARDAGRALYDAVYAEWAKLPENSRPKLIIYGLSLGSFGGQSAFGGINHLRLTSDGALFVGTPNETELWRNITAQRDKGSPEWQPIFQNGNAVRFADTNASILKNQTNWQTPRVLYMQHASDPVVWFNFDLLYNKPDWLNEKRGNDVSPTMRWYPFVTFIQVGIDQFFGTTVPNGHGHNYPNTIVNAWASVVPPPNWNQTKADRLQAIIDAYPE